MSLKINFNLHSKKNNFLLFYNKNFKTNYFYKYFDKNLCTNIKKLTESLSNIDKKKLISLDINYNQKLIIQKIENKNSSVNNEKFGASLFKYLKSNVIHSINLIDENIDELFKINKNLLFEYLHGAELKSYIFNKYKTIEENKIINFNISKKYKKNFDKKTNTFRAILQGTKLTKDLVSEPGNILHPDEYINRIIKLKKLGLKVTVYDKKKLKRLGMNALLGVGQGSSRGSYLATIEWSGGLRNNKPLAFIGKGVCFDTGGISLKPAKFMEDMTYDMAGSAAVVGLMKTLALRKAKVNAVGVVGLVENMPDGNAQRPGDIVKSYSGKTIEILNTDAEGRLVLADALTYAEKKFKPKLIIDLATLTGAIIVSLGSEYAGLFSNDDELSNRIIKAGERVDEKVWRMPLNDNYDKLIDSKKADMQNINYIGGAGSTTAAQFLQRFILNNTPWAHLDIAGMAFSKYGGALNSGGATGYGVRLLNQLIEDNYE